MPKFMTYQRPTAVSKANWGGKSGGTPFHPVRRVPAGQLPKPVACQPKLR